MPASPTVPAVLALGLALGLLHALDADHLLAVSTITSERPSPRRAALAGAVWGLGHALSLAVVGLAVVLFRWVVPPSFGAWCELAAAAMLVGLGVRAIRRGLGRAVVHVHVHAHDGHLHAHRHLHVRDHHAHAGLLHAVSHAGRGPFVVGVVHGLAGSAALALVTLATVSSPALGVAYVLVFGLGAAAGMTLASAAVALPLRAAHRARGRLHHRLDVALGASGVVFGATIALRALAG
jgi:ABC-type nickel/cobalt efflux system permease component RcnA